MCASATAWCRGSEWKGRSTDHRAIFQAQGAVQAALLARRALKRTPAGGELAVISDDPLAAIDIPYMCDSEGHEVAAVERLETGVRLVLRRGYTPVPSP